MKKLGLSFGLIVALSGLAVATTYPLTIETYNSAHEKVSYTFEKAPERVFAQNQNNIETLLALGLADKIVGAFGLDDPQVKPELQADFAKINYYDKFPGKETVLSLKPDFITGWYSTFDDKRLGDVKFWHDRGIGTYMSLNSSCRGPVAQAPQTVEDEMQDILTLGKIFNVEDKAQKLVDNMNAEIKKISDYLADKPKLTVAVLEDEGGSYRVYSHDTLGGNVAEHGGAQLAVGKKGDNKKISAEDLILANPDAIFMVWYDGYSVDGQDVAADQITKLITDSPKFAALKAVQNHRVYPLNLSGIYCSGLRSLDGILAISKALYPELYR